MTHAPMNPFESETHTQILGRQDGAVRGNGSKGDLEVCPSSNPLFRDGAAAFSSVMFVRDFDVPPPALGHLRRETRQIMGWDGSPFDTQGFVATNEAAADFLRGRGYVEVDRISEGEHSHPLFLPPLDAQLYRQSQHT